MSLKHDRFESALKEVAAEFIERESDVKAIITVTHVESQGRGERAIVYYTVLPESFEEQVDESLQKKKGAIREFLKTRLRLMRLPSFEFKLDKGEKNRQRIEDVI
jgi:ribosome-binding factor A